MQIEIIGYCPPENVGFPESFLANITPLKNSIPLSLYSDEPKWGLRHCENPARIRNSPRYSYFISNFCFFLGLLYAIQRNLDAFIYIESDVRCRGDFWADKMIEETLSLRKDFICAGSPVAYNVSDSGHSVLKKLIRYAHAHLEKTGWGMPILGFKPGLSLYSNGALAIYNTKVMEKIFAGFQSDIGRWSCMPEAWDVRVGTVAYQMFGEEVFNLVVPLSVTYSGCGDKILNEPERIQMLESGKVVGVHQIKSAYR